MNEPAFPCDVFDPQVNGMEQHEGMSLRDYFAAKAMQGILANPDWSADEEQIAYLAYSHADKMLAARSKA